MLIDLHTHTNISDGQDSPEELIQQARRAELAVIAITDHDTVLGWQGLYNQRDLDSSSGLTIVPGAEISCRTPSGMSVHMLGYLFDPGNSALAEIMSLTRDDRIPRMRKIIELLNGAGIDISFDDVVAHSGSAATVGRPHLADALVARGVVGSRNEAFAQYLHNDSPFYVGHFAPSPEEAIAAIKKAGGVSILAHGLAGSRGAIYSLDEIESLARSGLDGLEVDHRDHDESARASLRELADARGLFTTGSSDYHGISVGQRLAMEVTAPEVWEGILDRGKGCEVFTI
ncbi:MAG: PHP domain-containing protein [Actinomycetota bacterium]